MNDIEANFSLDGLKHSILHNNQKLASQEKRTATAYALTCVIGLATRPGQALDSNSAKGSVTGV